MFFIALVCGVFWVQFGWYWGVLAFLAWFLDLVARGHQQQKQAEEEALREKMRERLVTGKEDQYGEWWERGEKKS